ncbi:MAG: transcriptional repressor LexA [Deltaproteobacteria bacterium]|nr:transcriptional repressor LexA [Deltaproteobacteria bacterium]
MEMTRRQAEVLEYIKQFIHEHQFPPSVRDIASHFSLSSAGGIHKHLKNMEQKGILSLEKNISRSIRVMEPFLGQHAIETPQKLDSELIDLPIMGTVAAGAPIQHFLENEFFEFPASLVKNPEMTFVLKVKGNSMIEEAIYDGDYVLIESRSQADNGEMVVAMIQTMEATLKKIYYEGKKIRLQPANHEMEPLYFDAIDVEIKGIVVGLYRNYR